MLDNIRRQTFKDLEIIVADAASKDRTRETALSYGATVVDGGMPGPGRNRGAEHASGDTLLFLDADVALLSDMFLKECLEEMEKKKLNIATCRVKPISRRPIDQALHEVYNAYSIATEKIRPHAPGFCIFAHRNVHHDIYGFDEEVVFAEDHDYVQRAARNGFRFGVLRAHPIGVSVRRLDKDGRLNIALKYVYSEFHMFTKGAFRNEMPFDYEMGGDEELEDGS